MMGRRIWWVRRDARLHDQACLNALAEVEALLPVVVLDDAACQPVRIGGVELGFLRRSPRAQAFELGGLLALRAQLQARGSDLLFVRGEAAQVLADLAQRWRATELICSVAEGTEERHTQGRVFRALSPLGVRCQSVWQYTLVAPDQLPFAPDALPTVFTTFRVALERSGWQATAPLPTPPSLPPCDDGALQSLRAEPEPPIHTMNPRTAFPFAAGEAAALDRLAAYCGAGGGLFHYKATRNGLVGLDYASKLSPWLAWGQLSPRTVAASIKQHERRFGSHASSYWLLFELWWRDFFAFTAARYGARLFRVGGIQGRSLPWQHDQAAFARWCAGKTGDALVDAGQHELASTGYLGNRARQNVASYLIHDLGLDWRWGAAWFEHHLLDYDPASNYGNWQYIAGVGNDPRPLRRFDTLAQAQRYDPDGSYRALWASAP